MTVPVEECEPEAEGFRFARRAIWSVFAGLAAITFTALAISPLLPALLGRFLLGLWERLAAYLELWALLAIGFGLMAVILSKGWRDYSDTHNRSLAWVGNILGTMAIAISVVVGLFV